MTNNVFKQFRQGTPIEQGRQQPAQQSGIRQLYGQFQQAPAKNVRSCFKIPENIPNEPNAMLNYLTQSGQVTPQQLANAKKMLGMLSRPQM